MSKYILYSLAILVPFSASAAVATYELIAPIGALFGEVTLQEYLDGVFITTIGIAGILAVLMLVICGVQMMTTGSVSGKTEAKNCIWNAIFGLLLAIGSWILLNTINPLLLRNDADIAVTASPESVGSGTEVNDPMPVDPGWYFRYKDASNVIRNSQKFPTAASCITVKDKQKQSAPGSVELSTPQNLECFEVPKVAISASEKAVRIALCGNDSCVSNSSSKVYINHSACPTPGSRGCTNVATLPNSVINLVKGLATACNCDVWITGGTEPIPHKTHGPGLPIIDLRHTAALDTIIKSQNPASKRVSFSTKINGAAHTNYEWLYNGFWFTDEVNAKESHWHVCPVGYNTTYCRPL